MTHVIVKSWQKDSREKIALFRELPEIQLLGAQDHQKIV